MMLFFKVLRVLCGTLETTEACFAPLQLHWPVLKRTSQCQLISDWHQFLSHGHAVSTLCTNHCSFFTGCTMIPFCFQAKQE